MGAVGKAWEAEVVGLGWISLDWSDLEDLLGPFEPGAWVEFSRIWSKSVELPVPVEPDRMALLPSS